MTMIDTLKSSELFGGLSTSHLEKVAALCRSGSYRQNEMIFKEGDEATEIYVLTDGRVALEMEVRPVTNRPPIPTAVGVCTKGETLGWSALVEPYVYTLSTRCMTNCTVLVVKGDMLRKLMDNDVGLGYELVNRLAKVISRRLTETRLRLISGLGLIMLGRELGVSE
ncbi:MAG: cyclic nucleotide-binding domain-containing protein [Dehalococcoidia bacterium]|nr:cyclic nucleotide-binding domain-containing protein [Dehalococcoidia bacterium]